MLEAKGRVWKATHNGGHVIYISTDITKDSAYPFKPREDVNVQLDPKKKRLIITKIKETTK